MCCGRLTRTSSWCSHCSERLRRALAECEGVDTAETLFRHLEASQVDVLQARIEADSTRLKLHDAESRHRAVWRRLAAVIGVPTMPQTPLSGNLETKDTPLHWEAARERLLRESPELAAAHAAVQRARCEAAAQCAERVPNFDVRAAVRHVSIDQSTVAEVEVGMPLQIFNRNQGNIRRTQAQLIAAEHEVHRVELALQRRLATVFGEHENAAREVEKYSVDILPNAQKSLELVQKGYRQQQFDYLKLLTAQRTYFQVNLAYLDSLARLHSRRAAIDGYLLTGGLEHAPGIRN